MWDFGEGLRLLGIITMLVFGIMAVMCIAGWILVLIK